MPSDSTPARRSGVSADRLRAWERRYGLLEPSRTRGGFRLYGEVDVARVLAMRANLDRGLAAAGAARLGLSTALVSPLAEDDAGELIREGMRSEGVALGDPRGTRAATSGVTSCT